MRDDFRFVYYSGLRSQNMRMLFMFLPASPGLNYTPKHVVTYDLTNDECCSGNTSPCNICTMQQNNCYSSFAQVGGGGVVMERLF